MSIENELLRHEVGLLSSILIDERKRRKKGLALGLLEEDQPKFGQFFSPQKLQHRIEVIKETEAQQEQEKLQKAESRL